jgi:hypothetical protein
MICLLTFLTRIMLLSYLIRLLTWNGGISGHLICQELLMILIWIPKALTQMIRYTAVA